jgi:hypothetical protein
MNDNQMMDNCSIPSMPLRPPSQVMRLDHIGSLHPTRISFVRSLVRRMSFENWTFEHTVFDLDDNGYGTIVIRVGTPKGPISFVGFSNELTDEQRTDRVIAERWDTAFALVHGEVSEDELAILRENTPYQEAGRFSPREFVLSRANKSMRLFEHCIDRLSQGQQPDLSAALNIGYLMRTTAVYGNGKLGMADLTHVFAQGVFTRPYEAEMLMVYLVREFSFDLLDHVAKCRSPETAVPLDEEIKRAIGVGNATGLGMAPFLIGHPKLFNNWILARESAIARVRAVNHVDGDVRTRFGILLDRIQTYAQQWTTDDEVQQRAIDTLTGELDGLAQLVAGNPDLMDGVQPWNELIQWMETDCSLELQEMVISVIVELYPELVDDLEDTMGADETTMCDPTQRVGELKVFLEERYDWALGVDFAERDARHYFWYRSAEKEEPRLGERYNEPGADLETPNGIARDVSALYDALQASPDDVSVAEFLLANPVCRHTTTRVQALKAYPYSEIRGNLLGADCRPIDLLRCKLSIFGASKYDPKSDRWTRVTFFQGAPRPHQLQDAVALDWAFPVFEV